ncbi:MAG: hypothetical protein NZ765_12920, partial [Anaerolineae bacterium]|nr:hypothetical protein [Anaerolineae bacterium]MDW8071868.1 hypothetical protein [Anaerolineae bacterium]
MRVPSDRGDTQPIRVARLFGLNRIVTSQPRLWPLVAFWAGATFFFAAVSVLSAVRFMGILMSAD